MPTVPKRHRSFTPSKKAKKAPITFELYDETFEAYPELQGTVILEFASKMSAASAGGDDDDSDDRSGAAAASLIVDFFKIALKPESHERFLVLTHDPERIVDAEVLTSIVGWLMEEYTDRPLPE